MSNTNNTLKGKINTNTIIGLGLLTAIVVVMQFISCLLYTSDAADD